MNYNSPFKMRVWHGQKMQMVQTLCHNQGGAMWYAAGNAFGWAWINEDYDGWTVDNLKPSPADVSPVMRWTGLKDKNGADIWEGDIVKCREIWTASIHESPVWHTGKVFYVAPTFRIEADSPRVTFEDCEVIGTFYANPELLTP